MMQSSRRSLGVMLRGSRAVCGAASTPAAAARHGLPISRRCEPLPHRALGVQRRCKADEASKRFRIYTKTGDAGETSLYNGERRVKDDVVFEALGNADELSSFIGLAREGCASDGGPLAAQLLDIQCRLQELGSHIATPRDARGEAKKNRTVFGGEHAARLEQWIDEMDDTLPPLTTFILPSGGPGSATLHCCRSICRRAERSVVPLVRNGQVDESAYRYFNRLSDYLFTAARYTCSVTGHHEETYTGDGL